MNPRQVIFWGVVIVLVGAGFLVPNPEQDLKAVMSSPSVHHWFGTDSMGRDLGLRLLQGFALSTLVGILATVVAFVMGVGVSAMILYSFSAKKDFVLMRAIEILSSLPSLILVTVLTLFVRQNFSWLPSVWVLSISIGIAHWMSFARLTRGIGLQLQSEPFIEGARAIGVTGWRLFWVHEWPHYRPVLMIALATSLPSFILFESFLSFLGVGLESDLVSLGTIMNEGWKKFSLAPHLLLSVGGGVFLFLYLFQVCVRKRNDHWY